MFSTCKVSDLATKVLDSPTLFVLAEVWALLKKVTTTTNSPGNKTIGSVFRVRSKGQDEGGAHSKSL